MTKAAFRWSSVVLLCTAVWAQQAPSPKHKAKAKPAARSTAGSELKSLREAIAAQQQQLEQLRQQLQQRDASLQQLQEQVSSLQATASEASTAAQTASSASQENKSSLNSLQSTVADLKTNATSMASSYQEEQKRIGDLEQPFKIHFRGIDITPGGFIEAATIFRTRNENADLASSWGSLPFGGSANSNLTEFLFSARQSRVSLLAEGKTHGVKLNGYWEADFLGAAPTANSVETNSYNLRQRHLFGQAEFDNGMTFLGGQVWSLLTTSKKGIVARTGEWIPATIDAQYVVGFNFTRQPQFRFTKKFSDKVTWAFSVENPQTTLSVAGLSSSVTTFGFSNSSNAAAGSGFAVAPSNNVAPDLVTKLAFDPGWGHYEIKALGRFFRDRVIASSATTGGKTHNTQGGGLGFAAILPVVPKKVDFILEGLGGQGLGRYGAANGSDVTLRPDGTISPLHTYQALAGIETHPTPKFDFYVYGGGEYWGRTQYVDTINANNLGKLVGYGVSTADLTGCTLEKPTSSQGCAAVNKDVWEVTPGFWYRFYKGPYGTMQFGMQYSYSYRTAWPGKGSAPKGIENIVDTSFRYVLP